MGILHLRIQNASKVLCNILVKKLTAGLTGFKNILLKNTFPNVSNMVMLTMIDTLSLNYAYVMASRLPFVYIVFVSLS